MPDRRSMAARQGQRAMESVLARAEALGAMGPPPRAGRPRGAVDVLSGARAMLYRAMFGETFCLALAEAQAMGVPSW